jgi:large subunit ribosomal protein L6
MSKVWKRAIILPQGVMVSVNWSVVEASGPKWKLSLNTLDWITVVISEWILSVSVASDDQKSIWWLTKSLINNMVIWVSQWFAKKLLILWVGYWVKQNWQSLEFSLWFSHKINFELPVWVVCILEKDTKGNDIINLESIDKQLLWSVAADIRSLKSPEPYKWKGIRYSDEIIKLKAGKTSKK